MIIREEKENVSASSPRTPDNTFSSNQTTTSREKTEGKKESWLDIAKFVLLTAVIVLPIRFYIAQPFMVSGPSMEPTFMNNDYLLVDAISYRFQKPKRGEVVVFKRPEESKYLIKRVIGLPGETLKLENERITVINGENPEGFVLDQSFLSHTKSDFEMTVILDDNQYFVLGDNRPVSFDSRFWGPLEATSIIGRPVLRLYPFSKIGTFPGKVSAL